jgi:putative DNA primase/helicase
MIPGDFGPETYGDEPEEEKGSGLRVVGPEDESPFVYKGKKIAPTVGNAVIMLAGSREWDGLRFDKFRGEPSISNPPPLVGFAPPNPRLDGYSAAFISHWLGRRRGVLVSEDQAYRAADYASKAPGRSHHPVRDYLRKLSWDGTPRLDRFVSDYLAGKKNAYTSATWRCWMISAVARVMQPGCQVHHVPILEGDQGSGKSTAVRNLVPNPAWVNDSPVKVGEKDGMDALRGHWIVEFAELESLSNRESSKVKQFITGSVDTFRKAYGKDTEKFPRQCVMIGTVNPEEGYLKDPTGNRRFWPIKTGPRGTIKTDWIERDRDQLWAEAMVNYEDGKRWHFEDSDLIAMATDEQAMRTVVDPWEETVVAWIDSPIRASTVAMGVTIPLVLVDALGVPTKDHSTPNSARVGTILRKLGFHPRGSGRPRKYYRETSAGAADDFGPESYDN